MSRLFLLAIPLLSLTGCADPYERPGTWRATGINDANITAMLTTPTDSVIGRGTEGSRGSAAADAVARLQSGKRQALQDPRAVAAVAGDGGTANAGP